MFALLSTAYSMQTVDVSAKFYAYANSFCGGDGTVHNADIGNGNLVNNYKNYDAKLLGAEHYESRRRGEKHRQWSYEEMIEAGFKPGASERPSNTTRRLKGEKLGDCNEQWGNTCQNSGGLYHWCNYSQFKCMSKYAGQNGGVRYYNMNKSPAVPEVYELYYDNDEPVNTTSTITKTQTTTSEQTISTTVAVHVGDSIKIKAGIPDIMDVTNTFSWSFDMSTQTSDSKTTTNSFTWAGNIFQQAMTSTMVQFTITKESYSGAWEADIDLPYYAKLWCANRVNGHYEWFPPAWVFMGQGPYQGKGVFTGGAGLSMHTTVRTCKLFHDTVDTCDS